MKRRPLAAALTLCAAFAAAACSGDDDSDVQEAQATADLQIFGDDTSLFGDDRVGRQLKGALADLPADYVSFEQLFKVGRSCARPDGKKEIFIVEEAQTRGVEGAEATSTATTRLLPRAVITGCNTGDPSQAATIKSSYSLMAALISGDAPNGDTMSMAPLEVMAFDDRTGLFNFYVFGPAGVQRFWRARDGKVSTRSLRRGATAPSPVAESAGGACFRCHVNGAPLMNELAEPWTNWISPKKRLPTGSMSGTTKELVDAASLADQLEGIMRQAIGDYVGGTKPRDGWVNRTRDGLLPGGTAKLLEPLFCQTELNYVSTDTTLGIPQQVFVDPAVTSSAGLSFPNPPSGNRPVPFLLPVRAARDEVVERVLIRRGHLTDGMAVAIRLLDDENDVFSTKRCAVFDDVRREVAKIEGSEIDKRMEPRDVKELLRRTIESKLPELALEPARLAYLKARLAGTPHQQKQIAYNAELQKRFAAMPKDIARREAERKRAAHQMFPPRSPSGAPMASPLPILETSE